MKAAINWPTRHIGTPSDGMVGSRSNQLDNERDC
jgi:hypothetical protein